jgi:D-arabinose 5-phosphate isomerase GutQ
VKKKKIEDLSSFYSAYELLLQSAKRMVNSVNENPVDLMEFCKILAETKETNNRVHVVGMGRSGKVGMLLGEILKNIGYNVSYLGKSLAKPVRNDDVVIGVTGSGWTSFTTKAIEDSIAKGAKTLVLTGENRSKAARLADSIIRIPRPIELSRNVDNRPNHAPLTPMGTLFEMNSLVAGMGIFSGLNDGSIIKGFNEGVNDILRSAEMTLTKLRKNEEVLNNFIDTIQSFSCQKKKHVFIYGSGLDSIIASISSIRLSHLRINIQSSYDWRFRIKDDLLLGISGSGLSTSTLERVKSAKVVEMKIIGLTSFPKSPLAQECDLFLEIEGRSEKTNAYLQQISNLGFFVPSFEYVAAITLDACVAQIALNLGISESEMKAEHANIE